MEHAGTNDFRYNTGNANVPWDAVGVKPDAELVMDLIRFLVQPGPQADAYEEAVASTEAAVKTLFTHGRPATKLSLGKEVQAVEADAAAYLGCNYASFLVNWTAGYDIALDLVGVGPGDEVIVPPITFIATASPALRKGAKIVFGDVDPRTMNLDPADVARKITPRTKAIVPVHLGGYPVDMDPLMELAEAHGIAVIEDAAHGFGAAYKGKKLGTIGHFGAYSFHEVKNITSLGEGGILVTNDPLGAQFPLCRFVGFDAKTTPPPNWLYNVSAIKGWHDSHFVATNYSTTEIQAVALRRQIRQNEAVITSRRAAAQRLREALAEVPGILTGPPDSADFQSSHHLFLLRVDPTILSGGIMALKEKLQAQGVTQIAHFCPLYHYDLFARLGYDREAIAVTCPNAERAFAEEFTHLPLYGLSEETLDYMIRAVVEAAKELRK